MSAELINSLFLLHISIFQHSTRTGRGSIKMPLFSFRAPGHIGVDEIEASNLNLDFKSLPIECQNKLQEIFSIGDVCSQFELEGNLFKRGLIDSFLDGFRHTYFLSVVTNPLNRYEEFLAQARIHSECIAKWIESGTKSKSISVIIQLQVHLGTSVSIGHWKQKHLSMPEFCIEGQMIFQSPQEACERVFSSSFLTREMNTMPQSKTEILAEVDILTLSLWLGLGTIYRTQDVRFERKPWAFSPDEDAPLGIKLPSFWDNSRESLQLQTFVGFNMTRKHSFFAECINAEFHAKTSKWMGILSLNRKAIYSINMICDGTRDIARSVGEQSFRKDKIARDGIFKVISGMEGLNSECKPIDKVYGYKTKATKTFKECWSTIWRNALLADPDNLFLSKSQNIETTLSNIYSLRSDLAHADPTSMELSLKKVKISIGELFNPNEYDPSSVGITLTMIVDELLEYFYMNGHVLISMLAGTKPH